MGRTARHDAIAREMMTSNKYWPQDFLPLKRWKNGRLETGHITAPVDQIFSPITVMKGIGGDHSETDRIAYDSVEGCIADGWEVD
jgi:hypothetical protein